MICISQNPQREQQPRLRSLGTPLPERRELLTITPGLLYRLGDHTQLEVSVRLPLRGQDFPAGPQLMGGISYRFSPF